MIRCLLPIVLVFLYAYAFSQENDEQVNLHCEVKGCGNVLWLFEFDGAAFKPLVEAKVKSDSLFTFSLPKSKPTFYYLGFQSNRTTPLILGTEAEVRLSGRCHNNGLEVNFESSPINEDYISLKKDMASLRNRHRQLINLYRRNRSDEDQLQKVLQDMKTLDTEKLQLLDSLRSANPYFADIVALNTYLTYQNNEGDYENEIIYFAEKYFQFVDFSDSNYDRLPWVYEGFKNYVSTLSSVGLPNELHREYIGKVIDNIPASGRAAKMALSATVSVLRQKNHPNFTHFAERFIEQFKKIDPEGTSELQQVLDEAKQFMIGGKAPDFVQKTPEGEDIKLSDFRGKILLVDFWASWCGPCRKENPRVLAVYEQYKDKGFEILGVSLDKSKERWVNAIEQDGLTWHHVSDLQGWNNSVAKQYSIRSIPHTILLDEEGKIIARDLRGHSLHKKLEELFD